uniref:Uncharacterized protein LOC100377259 n=1 Tax=Saccoglossus kowalevskii TaxID=10224 RepID=A0ABM0GK64_SACKO|nr:PREDICTED: uncharacterized protein LOC100377259 [Saccoglossus kowalevskii]
MNPCNKSREYIEVPASVNRTEDNLCGCEDGWYQNYTTDNDSVCLENQMCPPGEGVADYGQCRQCHSNEYSDEWSTTQRCQPQPNCTEEVGGVIFEGNVTERTICNNTKDTIEGDLAKNSTLATSPNEMYMKNIINESTPYTHITNMTTTMTSILKKAEKEGELNYKLITVGAIVSGGLIAVIVAFVISEIRRVYRRRKGLMPSDAPPTRTTNSKGMAVQFADKRKKAKAEKSRTRKLENEATGEANENTPMLMETIERNDVRVVVWQPNKPGPEPELTIPLESWTPNSEERVTCV